MKFIKTPLQDVLQIELEKIEDNRGFFARSFCVNEFKDMNLCINFLQANISYNKEAGTLRGMHYQISPYDEVKLVNCINGSIFDVAVDLRKDSSTYLNWFGCDLTETNHKALYSPSGFAHGYQTLEPNTSVSYMVSNIYSPSHERGIRYDDPRVNIKWPLPITDMSAKDRDRNALDTD
jgi:dTDP-4-dehydrorhamnose 3,5-epimerase